MENQILSGVIAAIGTLAGVMLALGKLKASFKAELEEETKKAIEHARTIADSDMESLKLRLEGLAKDMSNLDEKFKQETIHIKETYNSEIRNLGNKIEDLREEIRTSHSSLISLLSKLVER